MDSAGQQIFRTGLASGDPGVKTLARGGTYTITVNSDSEATGTYQFKLWNVLPPQHFAIHIGDTVSKDHPAAGAGTIETPGSKDVYTFPATAGQQVNFATQNGDPNLNSLRWRLDDSKGTQIFSTCLGCGAPGDKTLTLGGTYTITVGSDTDLSTGTYGFELKAK